MTEPHIALIGNVNVDIIMGPQEPWPRAGTEVIVPDYEMRVGGQAANTAMALAALGVPFRLLTSAGDDVLGRWMRDTLRAAPGHWQVSPRPTTLSVGITHPNGERTFFTNIGHLEDFGPDDILPHLPEKAPPGSIALVAAAFLSPRLIDAPGPVLQALKAAGYRVGFDPGWPPSGWTAAMRGRFAEWLRGTDVLLVNEAEATAFAGIDQLQAAAEATRGALHPAATLVIKRGAEGASAWRGDEAVACAAPQVEVADSIGAGDIFNAGFLASEMAGRSLGDSLLAGVRLASAAIATRPRSYDPG